MRHPEERCCWTPLNGMTMKLEEAHDGGTANAKQ